MVGGRAPFILLQDGMEVSETEMSVLQNLLSVTS